MCHVVPELCALLSFLVFIKTKSQKLLSLVLLFCGGAIFGFIDHLWNGELFLISEYWKSDLLLGITISIVIFVVWGGLIIFTPKVSKKVCCSE